VSPCGRRRLGWLGWHDLHTHALAQVARAPARITISLTNHSLIYYERKILLIDKKKYKL
jgi:hypothetical protein